jgi:uncharacterized membrane protein YkgB
MVAHSAVLSFVYNHRKEKYNDQQKMDTKTKEHVQNTTQKLNIEQHEPLEKQMMKSAPSDG